MASLSKSTEPYINHAIAGAASGFLTRFICQPLDVMKIRFQLQVEPISKHHNGKYKSMSQALWLLLREEGVSVLWKGHVSAQLLSVFYGMTQFYSYNMFMQVLQVSNIEKWNYSMNFIAGAGAGSIATVVSFPFDTIRTRLVAQSSNHQVYNVSGGAAGLVAKTIIYPFDLAKKRLQIQGFQLGRRGFGKFFQCNGLLDCLIVTTKREGVSGLFKGLVPSQLKAVVTTALYFTIYEQTLLLLKQ